MSRLVLVLSILVGLVIAAFAALLVLLDNPEAYKQRLSDTFEAQTGYGLEINGSLNWQYFPPIAIGMSDVAVTIPGADIPLASLDSADLDLKVMPLLFGGAVEVSGITIDGLTINAAVDSAGKGNWEVSQSTQADSTPEDSTPAESSDASVDSSGSNLQLDIGGVSITNTVINYKDLSSNSDYAITLSELITGPLGTGVTTDIRGELKIEDKIAGMVVTNSLTGKAAINESLDEFTLEGINLDTRVEQKGAAPMTTALLLTGKVNTTSEQASLNDTSITIGGATFNLDLEAEQLFGATSFTGKLSANTFNAKALLKALDADPGVTANPDAMTKVNLSADISGDLTRVSLKNLKLGLDQSTLNGSASVVLEPKMAMNFNLKVDKIIASDYLAPSSTETTDSGSSEATEVVDSEVIPTEMLKEIDVMGEFAISELEYDTWRLQDLNLKITNRNNALAVNGTAVAYQGNIKFELDSRYPGTTAATSTSLAVSGVDIAKALEVEAITGTVQLEAKHKFTGTMMSNLTNTLDGQTTFNIADGTLDVRPIKQLAAIVDGIQGSQSGIAEWPDQMPFKSLNGNHKIVQGIEDNQTFSANLENMQITGVGGIDYFGNQMRYDIEAILLENVGGQFTVNPNLTGVKWPLTCAGPLDADPVSLCLPDRAAVAELIKKLAAEAVKKQGRDALQKKIDEKVPEELKDAAKGLLKGLFGN